MSKSSKPYRPPELKRDRARPVNKPAPSDEQVEARLGELVKPAVFKLAQQYRNLGLRQRLFTLPIMLAMVLAMIWRQFPSVAELLHALSRQSLLWAPPLRATESAFNQRLRCLPADLFAQVFAELVPVLLERASQRHHPQPVAIKRALGHFSHLWVLDASTLEAVSRKVGLLRGASATPLGGKLLTLLDLPSKLPVQLWLSADPDSNEKSFLEQVKPSLEAGTLLLIDRGFYSFTFFDYLSEQGLRFISRARSTMAFTTLRAVYEGPQVRDRVIALGQYRSNPCQHPLRLIEVQVGGVWHSYLTNELDPRLLPTADIVDLYGRRWRIESAFQLTKRLLGLSYLWREAHNAIALQVWATWLLYAVLIDLSDAVAEALDLPLDRISVEMVYRGLYHFTTDQRPGQPRDPVAYLAAQDDLGIVKRYQYNRVRKRLDKLPEELKL